MLKNLNYQYKRAVVNSWDYVVVFFSILGIKHGITKNINMLMIWLSIFNIVKPSSNSNENSNNLIKTLRTLPLQMAFSLLCTASLTLDM